MKVIRESNEQESIFNATLIKYFLLIISWGWTGACLNSPEADSRFCSHYRSELLTKTRIFTCSETKKKTLQSGKVNRFFSLSNTTQKTLEKYHLSHVFLLCIKAMLLLRQKQNYTAVHHEVCCFSRIQPEKMIFQPRLVPITFLSCFLLPPLPFPPLLLSRS